MKLNTDFPMIKVTDDERFNGVLWQVTGEMGLEDQPDGSGLLSYDISIDDSANPIEDMEAFRQYTGAFLVRAIEKGLEIEKS